MRRGCEGWEGGWVGVRRGCEGWEGVRSGCEGKEGGWVGGCKEGVNIETGNVCRSIPD